MPRDPNLLRHGPGHSRMPSQAVVGKTSGQIRTPIPGQKKPTGPALLAGGVVPVSVIDAFYQMLPSPDIQQQAIQNSIAYNQDEIGTGLALRTITTRPQQVYIWTDLTFYATIPGDGMSSPPAQLAKHQLDGLFRFNVQIDDINPMNLVTDTASPYNDPAQWTQPGLQSGWATLDRDFGSTRYGSAFALYARSQQITKITLENVIVGNNPRFVIDRIGFELHGYVASEGDFDELWRRTIGG